MEKTSFPFVDTPILTTEQLSKWAELFLSTGVIETGDATVDLNKLEVYADSTGMQVKVKTGKAFIKGHLFWGKTSEDVLAIATADPTNDRIDRVVAQLDWTNGEIDLVVLTGTPAGSPVPPGLTTDTAIWEISLAQILVDAAVSTIAAGKVTDEREFVSAGSLSELTGSISLSGDISPSSIGSNQNNYNPTGLSAASTLRLTSSGNYNITGLAGGSDGRIMIIHNIGSNVLTLKDEDASSTAANRFALYADVVLGADDSVWLQYDSTSSRWRLVSKALNFVSSPNLIIGTGTSVISTGIVAYLVFEYDCELIGWKLIGDQSGSLQVDLWKDAFSTLPDNSDSMCNGHEPALSSAQTASDDDLSDWTTTSISAGDIVAVNVDSATTIQQVTLSLKTRRT